MLAHATASCYNESMPHERILIVDDDKEILRLLRGYLEQAGYTVYTAQDGAAALHTLRREQPDLLLLDLMLPDRDGWEITRLIRSDKHLADTPIIMLTARIEDADKILGLELGADDYITKPFNPREVLARVRALLRRQLRTMEPPSATVQVGALRLDGARHEVSLDGAPIELTRTEFNLLEALMQSPGAVFTRAELVEKALGYNYDGIDRTLDTHIKNLRQKLGDDPKHPTYIHTVYGVGYRMAEPV